MNKPCIDQITQRQMMFRFASLSFLVLFTSFANAKTCNVTESSLIGAWQHANQAGFFEQMEFQKDGTQKGFNSWLHERPEISGGTWTLKDCVLQISDSIEGGFSFTYIVRQPRADRLELKEHGEPVGKYRRIKE